MESVKKLKKELKSKENSFNEIETINIKIKSEEELYSGYNYDKNEVLNPALGDFLLEKAEALPVKSKLRLKFFSDVNIKEHELFSAIKNKFKGEFENYQRKLKLGLLRLPQNQIVKLHSSLQKKLEKNLKRLQQIASKKQKKQ